MPPKKQSQKRRSITGEKSKNTNPIKKISRTRKSKKTSPKSKSVKRVIRKQAVSKRVKSNKRSPKRRVLEVVRTIKTKQATTRGNALKLRRNAKQRARYRLNKSERISVDSKYLLKRRSSDKIGRAIYSTKSLVGRITKQKFKIKKKIKGVKSFNPLENDKETSKLKKDISKYLKLNKRKSKKGKKAYIKLMIRDDKGNVRWISGKRLDGTTIGREPYKSSEEISQSLDAILLNFGNFGYEKFTDIIAYEIEQTV